MQLSFGMFEFLNNAGALVYKSKMNNKNYFVIFMVNKENIKQIYESVCLNCFLFDN